MSTNTDYDDKSKRISRYLKEQKKLAKKKQRYAYNKRKTKKNDYEE